MRKHLLLILLGPLLAVAACGSDGGSEVKGPTFTAPPKATISTETTIRQLDADEIDTAKSPYCATWAALRSAGGPKTGGLSDEEKVEKRKQYYSGRVPLVTELVRQAPASIKDAAVFARDATRDAAENGNFGVFTTEDGKAATAALAQYALDNCAKAGV